MKLATVVALIGALSTAAAAQAPVPSGTLLVLAKSDLTLSTVAPATFKVIGRLPSGPDPHEVVASADGRLAFVSNYGFGAFNTITVVDLVEQKALPPIDLGALRGPHGLAFVAGKLWFTAENAKVIGSYDPATRQIDLVLGTGQNRTHMIFVSADANRIVTSNVSSATLTIIEKTAGGRRGIGPGGPPPGGAARGGSQAGGRRGFGGPPQSDWDGTAVSVGRGVEGFDVSPNGREIWAANAQDGTVSIVDVATKKVTETLAANVGGANRLKFTPDGKLVFVSTLAGPDLTIIDAATRRETKRLKVGRGAAGIQMQPDGSRAYVAAMLDDYVAVIDLKSLEVAGRIEAGKQPDGMAWAVRR